MPELRLVSVLTLGLAVPVSLCLSSPATAQIDRDLDVAGVRRAVRAGAAGLADVERRWHATLRQPPASDTSWCELFGYNPPGRALTLAWLHAFLFVTERQPEDAEAAARYLERMADYRDAVPKSLLVRAEYTDGLPAVPSFFHLADYCEAWRRIAGFEGLDEATRRAVTDAIAGSADFVFVFPEWGPHNRAMLRAEGLLQAALALPDHPSAARWRRMAEVLYRDSRGQWEIEDAQIYHPIWLASLLRYADAAGDTEIFDTPQVRYYLRYFCELLSPAGTVPDFGDAWWDANVALYYFCLEWGASALRDPELKWAAERLYAALGPLEAERPDLGRAVLFARLAGRTATDLPAREPRPLSGPLLDDVIGKKLVFRTGRGPDDLYLLLNYRDEGDFGLLYRDYLRQTLAVREEKAHHGNSDENAIVLFMDGGSVLLHDAGYREVAPSGPFGAYRADIFHNRLVVRRGQLAAGQDVLGFLRNSGAHRRVRTQKIDFVSFDSVDYGRTRVTDQDLGYTWDRTIVFPREPRLIVVVDSVRFDRAGEYTLSTLWATRRVIERAPRLAVGEIDRIEGAELPAARRLLLLFPGAPDDVPGLFPLRRHRQDEQVLHETRSRRFDEGDRTTFVTVLWPVTADRAPAEHAARIRRLDTAPPGRTVGVAIGHGGETLVLGIKTDLSLGVRADDVRPRYDPQAGRGQYGPVATDADFVFVRLLGTAATWGATNMTHVKIGDRLAFEAKPFQVFQTTGRSDVIGRSKWRRWEGRLR